MSIKLKKQLRALAAEVGTSSSGLTKDVADLEDAIGTETTSGTILYRIKALETAAK